MAFNLNFGEFLQRISAAASQPHLTLQDVEAREMEAFNELHSGNVTAAVRLYTQLINQLEIQLRRSEDPESANPTEQKDEDDNGTPSDERAELEAKLLQLKDQRYALQLAHEINPEFTFRDAAMATRAMQGRGAFDPGDFPEDRDEQERMRFLAANQSRILYFWRLHVPFNFVILALGLFFASSFDDICTLQLKIVLFSYLAFLPLNYFVIMLIQRRLHEIGDDLEMLDHIHSHSFRHSLWPQPTLSSRIATFLQWFIFLGRIAWIIAGLYVITNVPQDCPDGSLDSMLYIVIFFGNLNEWAIIGMFLTALAVLIVCCPCVSYLLYYVYDEYQKQKPVGMRKNELKKLPERKYKVGMIDGDDDPICVVCQLEFEEGEVVRQLPCEGQHTFHKECVDTWLKRNEYLPTLQDSFWQKEAEAL